jgi:hypothetical protein
MEKDIDDLVERAAFNESQKTFQQMSQKDALKLAKDVYEFDLKATVVILKMLLGVTFPNVVVVSLIVTRVIGLFVFR